MKAQQQDSWKVEHRPVGVWLHRELLVTKEGVGTKPAVRPATIVQARYGGIYEGAPWLCFAMDAEHLTTEWRDWDGDELQCQEFFRKAQEWDSLIGRGDSPTAAYDDLVDRACSRAGVDRAALTKQPT